MSISRKRVLRIKYGKAEPANKQEWAILAEHLRRVNRDRITNLHNHAAIRLGKKSAGKVVVVPPQGSGQCQNQ